MSKCTETRGNWAQVVLMALYFLRYMPNRCTNLSPFALKHGLEPTKPLQLLYKGWVEAELRPVNLEEWVMDNADRVQCMRITAVVNQTETTAQRKREWVKKAQVKQFDRADEVYLRKVSKLSVCWVGPCTVENINSPLSCRVHMGERVLQSVHVQLLKKYIPRPEETLAKIVTTVLEPNCNTDNMDQLYAEATVTGRVVTATRDTDIASRETDFADILTKEPGFTKLAQFRIDMAGHPPICQGLYNTPHAASTKS